MTSIANLYTQPSPSAQVFRGTVRVNYYIGDTIVKKSAGSGFFFEFPVENGGVICLVTAKHVTLGASKISFLLAERGAGNIPDVSNPLQFDVPQGSIIYHPVADICVAPIGPTINKFFNEGRKPWPFAWRPEGLPTPEFLDQLRWIEDVFMVGCPAGIYDEERLIPIARRVTTATPLHIDYKGEKKFLVDGHVYTGSSGSPIILINEGQISLPGGMTQVGVVRTSLLGIVTDTLFASDHTEIGLGVCLKSSVLLDFIKLLPNTKLES